MLRVFISHAEMDPQDAAARRALETQLAQEVRSGAVHLWHRGLLDGGEDVAAAPRHFLRQAHVVAVLLSPSWLADSMLGHDVAAATRTGATVLPVLLRPCRVKDTALGRLQPLPRGGRPILSLPPADQDQAWMDVADAIMAAERPALEKDTTIGDVLRAALRLDRQPQWKNVEREYQAGGSVLFYLHGHWDQSVNLFAQRLRTHFLRDLSTEPHELLTLRVHEEDPRPRIAAQWSLLLRDELLRRRLPGGELPDLLHRAADARPLFVLIGGAPFDEQALDGCEDGLREFVTRDLPGALVRARPRWPMRALLCAQHFGDRLLVERIASWAAQMGPGLRLCPLPELTLPQRQDIEDYLKRYEPPLLPARKQRVLDAYDRMVQRGVSLNFDGLARLLDEYVEG
jgi:hypothetical protein